MKYNIGGIDFRTKKEVISHVQEIMRHTDVGDSLCSDDFIFVVALLKKHRRSHQKIGCGIESIRIDLNTQWKKYKMFVIVRKDGSSTDFSYRSCLYPATPDADFREACRHAVVNDILAYKQRVFGEETRCAITGTKVSWNDAHIDHAPPWTFKAIVDAFLREKQIDYTSVILTGYEDGECQHRFNDQSFADMFRCFHNKRASLRVVTESANLKMKRKNT